MYKKKYYDPVDLDFDQKISRLSRPLIFTNGVFDIVHATHVEYLEGAKCLGGTLLVALNDDQSAFAQSKSLIPRPVQCLQDRITIISGLASVDVVTYFSECTPLNLIRRIKPDIIAKGTDYKIDQILGKQEVEAYGGGVVLVDTVRIVSTTEIIAKIRQY